MSVFWECWESCLSDKNGETIILKILKYFSILLNGIMDFETYVIS